jgi:hypothetical protein
MADLISIWGGVLSTALAAIKIWEVFRDRSRLIVSYSFDSRPEVGNTVILANPSKNPVMIEYFQLFWKRRTWFSSKTYENDPHIDPEFGECNITIAPYSKYNLRFCDEDYFDWKCPVDAEAKLYIRLYIVGQRRPVIKLVYPLKSS